MKKGDGEESLKKLDGRKEPHQKREKILRSFQVHASIRVMDFFFSEMTGSSREKRVRWECQRANFSSSSSLFSLFPVAVREGASCLGPLFFYTLFLPFVSLSLAALEADATLREEVEEERRERESSEWRIRETRRESFWVKWLGGSSPPPRT